MPTIMDQPYPIEFVREGDNILLRIEEYDTRRTIQMDGRAAPTESPLGHSVGRWDGTSLVVTTTNMNWPWFNQSGIPQSDESVVVERFTPTEDGARLEYVLTVTDPVNFSEPITQDKYWVYVPAEGVLPFDCIAKD